MDAQAPGTIPYYLRERIRELIVDGTLRPGQPLREQDLESRFNTSRSPIREALRMLEQSGLVTHMQRRGFRVTVYTEKEIVDQYKLRAELEAYAILELEQLADAERDSLIERLKACHARMGQAYAAHDAPAYLAEIRNFYSEIVACTNNKPLDEALSKLTEKAQPLRYNLISRRLDQSKSLEITYQIIEALAARNFTRAAALKREHVLMNLPAILEAYAEARGKP
ncbi:MAG: GntR family transcriptional regulator [Candidimonas sp.]|jgi:DNA-binding GntR family transcriptional regulator